MSDNSGFCVILMDFWLSTILGCSACDALAGSFSVGATIKSIVIVGNTLHFLLANSQNVFCLHSGVVLGYFFFVGLDVEFFDFFGFFVAGDGWVVDVVEELD